jgi:hypothetical protein
MSLTFVAHLALGLMFSVARASKETSVGTRDHVYDDVDEVKWV